ncbi:MAG: hypothetical protein MZV65_31190 [Chromatiales bacterium]|nr:hypothetical protein [Chromatiales bacterium]
MYLLMFAAGIFLRHTEPQTARPYRVPGGEAGMWIVAGAGLVGPADRLRALVRAALADLGGQPDDLPSRS